MSCEGDTAHELRETGRRFTVQRLKVAAALRHCGGHRTAEEIHELLTSEDPHAAIPLSTVYRTLATLKELRLVSEVDAGARATYEWVSDQPHHHLVCRRCGTDVALDPALLASLSDEIRSATGFEAHLDHLAIHGACAGCRAESDAEHGGVR